MAECFGEATEETLTGLPPGTEFHTNPDSVGEHRSGREWLYWRVVYEDQSLYVATVRSLKQAPLDSLNSEQEIRTLRRVGIALASVAGASAAVLFLWSGSPFCLTTLYSKGSFLPLYVIGLPLAFYMAAGVGSIWRTRWGYVLLKCLLYSLFLAFPVGTVGAYVALSYVRRHRIKRHFGFAAPSPPIVELHEERWFKVATVALVCALALVFVWMMLAF